MQREKKHVASVMEESTQECWKEHSRADMHSSQGVREQILPKPEILLQKKKKKTTLYAQKVSLLQRDIC